MQVPWANGVHLATVPTGGGVIARVVAGPLHQLPIGELLEATVTAVSPRGTILTVHGTALTVRPPYALAPGAVVLVRVPPPAARSAVPTLELSPPAPLAAGSSPPPNAAATTFTPRIPEGLVSGAGPGVTTTAASVSTPGTSHSPESLAGTGADAPATAASRQPAPSSGPLGASLSRPVVVDVLNREAEGQFRVQIEGQEAVVRSAVALQPGARYVLQVERTPQGLRLQPPAETPQLPQQVATAVLRTLAQPVAESVSALQIEINQALTSSSPSSDPPVPVQQAVASVGRTLQGLLPADPRPLQANEIHRWVVNSGLLYEAKLAQVVEESNVASLKADPPTPTAEGVSAKAPGERPSPGTPPPEPAQAHTARGVEADLKADLLRLLQTVQEFGSAARPTLVQAAQAVLTGIEAQQAFNVVAQSGHLPYMVQVPFPDNGVWRTLRLALEPEYRPGTPEGERSGRFRLLMHVPLQELGETWIDARLSGDQFRATIYLDSAAVRQRVAAAVPELHAELAAEGFAEVLLDVRAASELPDRQRKQAAAMQAGRPESVTVVDVRV